MVGNQYSECFWGGDLRSKEGCETLIKRNHDGKKTCQDIEDYLKKRAKLENEFAKSLKELSKCFKNREPVGDLEAVLNAYMVELESMAISHIGVHVFFSKQADEIKSFREAQVAQMKQAEERLVKAQNSKINQLKKTSQLENAYKKKGFDRDDAEVNKKDVERENSQSKEKDLQKAQSRLQKAEEDLQKADDAYKTAVHMLDDTTSEWERAMECTCKIVQDLDEKRVRYLRNELWVCLNVDSKLALDIDNCCESMRQRLEKCDVSNDIQSFLDSASTGTSRPRRFAFKHYKQIKDPNSDGESISSMETCDEDIGRKGDSGNRKMTLSRLKNPFKM